MDDSMPSVDELIHRFARAETLAELPSVVDVLREAPPNPPESVQTAFVGSSYVPAYAEAASFVRVADEWLNRHQHRRLSTADRVIDFGSGWGRITRLLLAHVPPIELYALDVDQQMTALVGTTLPGVNAVTVAPIPPTVFRDGIADVAFAFSVFSHLAPAAHVAWAAEFGRLTTPGAMVFLTLLDDKFFAQVESAKEAVSRGEGDQFAVALADCLPDAQDARRQYERGEPVYAGVGGGGVRAADFYGWAAIPHKFIESMWGDGGFDIVEWVPSGILFPQAMVGLVKRSGSRQ
jgi:methyltransferase family protein